MSTPEVSIVMPTYNRAHLIGESIQSVLDQTFQDFELIIVDDGSSDDTEAVVKRFNDPRIRYIYQQNKGQSGATNTGIRNARGKYIAFLDSDDLWVPELLEVEVAILDAKPDIGLVYAKAQAMDEKGNPKPRIRGAYEKYPGETLKSMLYGDFSCIQTTLVRRECFDLAGLFDETLKGRVDWDMFLRIAKHYRFAHINKILAKFRFHPGQKTGPESPVFVEVFESRIRVLDKAFSSADLPEEVLAIRPLAYRNAYIDVGLHWLSIWRFREAFSYFWKSIKVSPNPLGTPFRILYLVLFNNFLSKTMWGNRLISKLIDLRRKWHTAPML